MLQITLRSELNRRISPEEYDGNLINFQENIENLKLLIDSCCGTQSWSSYDPIVLTTDSPDKLDTIALQRQAHHRDSINYHFIYYT